MLERTGHGGGSGGRGEEGTTRRKTWQVAPGQRDDRMQQQLKRQPQASVNQRDSSLRSAAVAAALAAPARTVAVADDSRGGLAAELRS